MSGINLSFILPFYKRAGLFKLAMEHNAAYRCEDVELVCVLDDPSDEEPVIAMALQNPKIKFRVLVCDQAHEWRCPSKAINAGIRHAAGAHLCIMDPEIFLNMPAPNYLQGLFAAQWDVAVMGLLYTVVNVRPGMTRKAVERRLAETEAGQCPAGIWAGLAVSKYYIEQINGYNESITKWGGEDVEVRARLLRFGVPFHTYGSIRFLHPWHEGTARRPTDACSSHIVLNQPEWGKTPFRTAHDWMLQ